MFFSWPLRSKTSKGFDSQWAIELSLNGSTFKWCYFCKFALLSTNLKVLQFTRVGLEYKHSGWKVIVHYEVLKIHHKCKHIFLIFHTNPKLWNQVTFSCLSSWKILTTNKKGQFPPQLLITLTRGIQIHGQPIKNYSSLRNRRRPYV